MDPASKPDRHHCDRHRRRKRRHCVLISVASLLFVFLLVLVLALTVFRVRDATNTVNSVRLTGFRAGLNPLTLAADLNLTLLLDVTAYNPNKASFKYSDGSAEIYYRGTLAGEAEIPPGEVAAEGEVRTDVILTVLAGRLIAYSSTIYRDLTSGSVTLTTRTMIPGRVTVLGFIKHHMVLHSTCDVMIDITDRTVENSNCRYETKL